MILNNLETSAGESTPAKSHKAWTGGMSYGDFVLAVHFLCSIHERIRESIPVL